MVTSTMKSARKSSFKTSMLNLVKAADHYYADHQLDITSPIAFDFIKGGTSEAGEELSFKGTKPKTGRVIINGDGEITLQDVSDGRYYANYNSDSDDDVMVTEDNEILTRDELTDEIKKLKKELENTKSELVKKANQSDLEKTNTQLSSTTTIANTANTTANSLANTRLDKTYPVGSIYISYSSTNPASLFGGTWVNYGSGRMLKGISSGTAGSTGGASSVTLTTANLPSHTHSVTAKGNVSSTFTGSSVTTSSNGAHSHTVDKFLVYKIGVNDKNAGDVGGNWTTADKAGIQTSNTGAHTHTITAKGSVSSTFTGSSAVTSSVGNSAAINIENPYITVYMWKRTA